MAEVKNNYHKVKGENLFDLRLSISHTTWPLLDTSKLVLLPPYTHTLSSSLASPSILFFTSGMISTFIYVTQTSLP